MDTSAPTPASKVGERYETVDTQKPEMENQLADVIRGAVQTGTERIQIHLAFSLLLRVRRFRTGPGAAFAGIPVR